MDPPAPAGRMFAAVRFAKRRNQLAENKFVVAIDGPAGAGKSTIARRVAAKLGFVYVDTGAMYRAVGLWALRTGVTLDDARALEQLARRARIELGSSPPTVLLNGEDVTEAIRTREVSEAASRSSAVPGVRRALVEKQRRMAAAGRVVMEGRDIGTVVCPDAEVKVFLDADPAVRVRRRLLELSEKGAPAPAGQVAREMEERDRRDRNRSDSPLVRAPDAVYVDTTGLSLDEVEGIILEIVRDRIRQGKESSR